MRTCEAWVMTVFPILLLVLYIFIPFSWKYLIHIYELLTEIIPLFMFFNYIIFLYTTKVSQDSSPSKSTEEDDGLLLLGSTNQSLLRLRARALLPPSTSAHHYIHTTTIDIVIMVTIIDVANLLALPIMAIITLLLLFLQLVG